MAHTQIKRLNNRLDRWPLPHWIRKTIHVISVIAFDALRSDLLKQASAMAYVSLLSLVPSLVAIFCVFSLFTPLFLGQRNLVEEIKNFILVHLASGSGENAVQYLDQMLQKLDLKTIGWSSFASVLITLVLLLRQIEIALNNIWQIKKSRNVFIRFMYFWTFLTLLMLGTGALVGLSIPDEFGNLVNPQSMVTTKTPLGQLLKTAISLVGSTVFFFLLYKVIPNCKVYRKPALIGAFVSAVLINEGGYLYGLFVRDSSNYKTIYGALAQLPIFLMWLYFCWSIILLGALISWRVQEGFPKLSFHDALDDPKTPSEKYRNLKIQSILPHLALIAVSKRFTAGDKRGLSSQEFAHHFDIPISWASEAFEYLFELGLIHSSSTSPLVPSIKKGPLQLSNTYEVSDPCFPSVPPSLLLTHQVHESLETSTHQWLISLDEKIPFSAAEALLQFSSPTPHNKGASIQDLLAKFPPVA